MFKKIWTSGGFGIPADYIVDVLQESYHQLSVCSGFGWISTYNIWLVLAIDIKVNLQILDGDCICFGVGCFEDFIIHFILLYSDSYWAANSAIWQGFVEYWYKRKL